MATATETATAVEKKDAGAADVDRFVERIAQVRALAREWGRKRVYLAPGGWGNGHGGACRNQTGIPWARVMVCLVAMQGLGKPGVNMGNLQWGTPVDFNFYFPGYAEGGMSGDIEGTSLPVELYQRMPQLPTMNSNGQQIPRIWMPEAIMEGKAEGYRWIGKSIEHQFQKFAYPAPGASPVRMLYKYGGSHFGTVQESNRLAEAYRKIPAPAAPPPPMMLPGKSSMPVSRQLMPRWWPSPSPRILFETPLRVRSCFLRRASSSGSSAACRNMPRL